MSSFVEKNKKGGKAFPLTAQGCQFPRLISYEERSQELDRALRLCYGEYPYGWSNRFPDIMRKLDEDLPKVNNRNMPYSTYFLHTLSEGSLTTAAYIDVVVSEPKIKKFLETCQALEDAAKVTAVTDFQCFEKEVEAFDSQQEAIQNPHLDISPLYRYMAAVQQDQIVLITDELQAQAIHQLRMNPYGYFAYGDDFVPFMPITWGDL